MRRHLLITTAMILLAGAPGIYASDTIDFDSTIDWGKGILEIRAKTDLAGEDSFIPAARQKSERLTAEELPVQFREAIAGMIVDSTSKAGELTEKNPQLIPAINDLTYRHTRTFSHISPDLEHYSITYTYRFYPDIVDVFIFHNRPDNPPRVLAYEPTADFSGIVIYMKGELPVHGEQQTEKLTPCLFPKIFDENMKLIYEKGMVEPEMLRSWGMVVYTDNLEERPYEERIGLSPLRILGRKIFGEYYTDIVIEAEAAEKILYNPHNRRLLAEGRVMIICELPAE